MESLKITNELANKKIVSQQETIENLRLNLNDLNNFVIPDL